METAPKTKVIGNEDFKSDEALNMKADNLIDFYFPGVAKTFRAKDLAEAMEMEEAYKKQNNIA